MFIVIFNQAPIRARRMATTTISIRQSSCTSFVFCILGEVGSEIIKSIHSRSWLGCLSRCMNNFRNAAAAGENGRSPG